MLKRNKIILSVAASLIGAGTILAASLTPIILKANPTVNSLLNTRMSDADWNNNAPFEFDNKNYLNLNDAYNDLVNKVGGINTQQFIGEINNKNEDGSIILANNPVYEYNLDKITTAYMDANGRYTNNYDKAINSFVNASTLVANYYDYKGNYFLDEEDAKYSMNSFGSMGIAYYEIEDYQGNKVKINPLNTNDINNFKKIAYDWIVNKDNTNIGPSPFALKLVGKDDNQVNTPTTYSKSNEVTSKLVDQWSEFVKEFKANLREELSNVILNVLENNAIIKTEIYIKPYILDHDKNQEECYDNLDSNLNDDEDKRFMWYFDQNGQKKLSIESKSLKLDDFNNLAKILTNRNDFNTNFQINRNGFETKPINGWNTYYETANPNNNFVKKYFNSNFSVSANMPKVKYNTLWYSEDATTAKILTKSDTYTRGGDKGPKWINNYMLTFGIRPYIDKDAQIAQGSWNSNYKATTNSNKMSFSDFISSLTDPNFKNQALNEYNSGLYNSIVSSAFNQAINQIKDGNIDIYNFLKYYNNNSCINIIDKNVTLMEPLKTYTNNIFNYNVVKGLDTDDPNNESNNKKTSQFSRDVYNKLCDWFGIRNNQYNDFNSAIDMHQLNYYDNKFNKNNSNNSNDYLGSNTDGLIDNFITIKDLSLNLNSDIQSNFKYIITYNDMPVFEINNKYLNSNKQWVNNLLNASGFKKNNSSTTTQTYSEDSFNPELFTNISTSYSIVDDKTRINKSNNYVIDNTHYVKYEDDNPNLINVGDDEGSLSSTYNHLPTDNSEPPLMKRGIYDAASLYNQNVQKLGCSSNDTNKDLISNYEPTDFLMLFKNAGTNNQVTPLELHYCETYCGVDNINLSLSSQFTNSKLAFNYDQLSELKERLKVFNTPAKVYFIYHNDNLLIKDKIEYNASNPDFIDNPELVIQNALRKYGLAPETDHIMYNTGNGYVSLLNNVFVLYNFTLNDRNYYFDSFANAKDKLISYIKYNSYKI